MKSVSIIGAGRVGGALAIGLSKAGYNVERLVYRGETAVSRLPEGIRAAAVRAGDVGEIVSDIIFITTQDPEISAAADWLAHVVAGNPAVLHTSGPLSSDILAHLKTKGCSIGSLHPLVAVSTPEAGAKLFPGSYFCIEGDDDAAVLAREVVQRLGGNAFSVDSERKTLYHAAAVTAAGHVTALFEMAISMMEKCGIERGEAQKILLPLTAGTVENLRMQSPEAALTGPFARYDEETFERHRKSFEGNLTREETILYLLLGERSTDIAARSGEKAAEAESMREKIDIAKKKLW